MFVQSTDQTIQSEFADHRKWSGFYVGLQINKLISEKQYYYIIKCIILIYIYICKVSSGMSYQINVVE